MIDIPDGKALVAVETNCDAGCDECYFDGECPLSAVYCNRKDDKNVIFKLVDITNKNAEIDDFFVVPHGYQADVDKG